MTSEVLSNKICEYAINVLSPKAKTNIAKYVIGSFLPRIKFSLPAILAGYGVVGKDGEVDVDTLEECVVSGLNMAGSISVFNGVIGFDANDAKDLFAYIKS